MSYLRSSLVLALSIFALLRLRRSLKRSRTALISPTSERVLIVGATSGIGRHIAQLYAQRGARVCIVGRREALVEEVRQECSTKNSTVLGLVGDFSNPEDLVRIRESIHQEWSGLDTLIISAGVSSLLPILSVASAHPPTATGPSAPGLDHLASVTQRATQGNLTGPLLTSAAFIPYLSKTSASPSILLISSLASVIPAPTRALYAASKGASLLAHQALAIEHPNIKFSFVLPSTVEGNFRASAVDGGEAREDDPAMTGLKVTDVARRCIRAVDDREGVVWLPRSMVIAPFVWWAWPAYVERKARIKYKFNAA